MLLPVVALFLLFAVLIAAVVTWPRQASHSSARLIAEALGWMVLTLDCFICTVLVRAWVLPRW